MPYRRRTSSYQLLRLAEETGRIGFWWLDLPTGEIGGSVGLAQISGLSPGASPRGVLDSLIHPADRAAQAGLWDALHAGQAVGGTFRIVRPDRILRWITIRSETVVGPDHQPVGIEGVVFDVTDPHEARAAAEQSLARYRTLIEAIAAVVWTTSPDGHPKPSAGWEALTGQSTAEMQDGGWLAVVHPDDRTRAQAAWQAALTRRTAYHMDFRVRAIDGSHRPFTAHATPLRNGDGSVREWMGILLERTEARVPPPARPSLEEGSLDGVTGRLMRGARALLDWSIADLAAAAGVSVSSVKRFEEDGASATRAPTRRAMQAALEAAGIRFVTDAAGREGLLLGSDPAERR